MIRTGFLSRKKAVEWILSQVSEAWPNLKADDTQVSYSDELLKESDGKLSEDDAKFELVDVKVAPDFGLVIPYMSSTGHLSYACKAWVPEHRSEVIASVVIKKNRAA